MYLFTHAWKLIPNAYEAWIWNGTYDDWPQWLQCVSYLSHCLIAVNSSLNFVIYLIF